MNCFTHPELAAVSFCRTCGKALCQDCRRVAQGSIFCEEHVPAAATAGPFVPPAAAPPATGPAVYDNSPGLAVLLGFIPGVGAIYNGQYAKGIVHAIIFGLLVSIESSGAAGGLEPLFGVLIAAWVFYMVLEAYHTARKRRNGEPVDEFSSLVNLHGEPGRFPAAAVALIVLGVILLLNTLGLLDFRYIVRYWPVLLIVLGVYMLWARLNPPENGGVPPREPQSGNAGDWR
jgi:hypothetical protein